MNALEHLETVLQKALANRPRQLNWGDSRAMANSLEAVRDAFGSHRAMAREQRIARGLMALRIQGKGVGFVHLKYACWGVAQPMDWESRRLLEDEAQMTLLLERVRELRGDTRRFAACYRGLLASWTMVAEERFPANSVLARNREHLRQFLSREQGSLPAERQSSLPPELCAGI